MIGLSLSMCVSDLMTGTVALDAVDRILSSTLCTSDTDWDDIMARYRATYWRKDPELGESIARGLLARGLIEQPRLYGREAPNIGQGWWRKTP